MADQKLSGNGAYQVITPPNTLKAKVGPGKGVDPRILERAQSVVESMAGDFEARAIAEAGRILHLAEQLGQDGNDDAVADIARIGHELKGQGGTFDYPLITKIGASLCQYIESVSDDGHVDAEIVRAHGNALRAMAGNKVTGDGGALEQELIRELDRLLKKTIG